MFDAGPVDWRQGSFASLGDYANGRAFRPKDWGKNGLPIIRIAQITNPGSETDFYDGPVEPRHLIEDGDLIFSWSATLAVVRWNGGPAVLNQHLFKVTPAADIDRDWLQYRLEASIPDLADEAHGTTMKHIRKGTLTSQTTRVPPLGEQRRIADVIRSVDRFILLTSETLAAAQSGKNAALIAALGEAWPETSVEELLATTRYPMRSGPFGSALLKSELTTTGIPFLGIDNVQVERFVPTYKRFISQEKYRELARYTVYPDDVMVTIMGTVGRCCVVPPDVGTAISSKHVWTLTLDAERYSPSLLAWQVNHAPWVLDQLSGSSQGGIMSAISSGTLRGLVVPLPPPTELREIEQLLLSCNTTISALEAELESAEATKTAVMADLLSGRVRVPA